MIVLYFSFLLLTWWVNLLGKLEGIWGSQIRVSWSDSQNQRVLSRYKLHEHVPNLELDVRGLVTDRDLRETRQVNQRQIQYWMCVGRGRERQREREREIGREGERGGRRERGHDRHQQYSVWLIGSDKSWFQFHYLYITWQNLSIIILHCIPQHSYIS